MGRNGPQSATAAVNEWLAAGAVLLAGLLPLVWIAYRRQAADALVALNQAGLVVAAARVVLSVGRSDRGTGREHLDDHVEPHAARR